LEYWLIHQILIKQLIKLRLAGVFQTFVAFLLDILVLVI
jgi:hypothetical protein